MRFYNLLLIFILINLFIIEHADAQIKAVNDKGEKIIVYPDGSWEYDPEEKKQDEEEKGEQLETPESYDTQNSNPNVPKKTNVKNNEPPKYTIAEMKAARTEITKWYQTAKKDATSLSREEDKKNYELNKYQNEIELQRKRGNFPKTPTDEDTYLAKVKMMKKEISSIKKGRKSAQKKEKRYKKMLTTTMDGMMASYTKEKEKLANEDLVAKGEKENKNWLSNPLNFKKEPKTEEEKAAEAKAQYEKELANIQKKKEEILEGKIAIAQKRSQSLEKYETEHTYPLSTYACDMAFEEIDVFSGQNKKGTKRAIWFTNSTPAYMSASNGGDYLVCNSFISQIDNKNYLLILDIVVNNKNARRDYGGIQKGAKMVVKLLDGNYITMKATNSSSGEVNAAKDFTTFKVAYNISKQNRKAILKTKASKVIIHWEGGYQEYHIYDMDFLKNQIECILTN